MTIKKSLFIATIFLFPGAALADDNEEEPRVVYKERTEFLIEKEHSLIP